MAMRRMAKNTEEMNLGLYVKRWAFIAQGVVSMTFAWCILATGTTAISCFLNRNDLTSLGYKPNGAAVRAVLAMGVSIVAFLTISLLDMISDRLSSEDNMRAARGIIRALGVLVGFSWEQAFAGGVESIVEIQVFHGEWFPVILQWSLAAIIGVGVVPAWRMYILRNLLVVKDLHEEMDAARTETLRQSTRSPDSQRRILQYTEYASMEVQQPGLHPGPAPRSGVMCRCM